MEIGSKVIITRAGPYKGSEGIISSRCREGSRPFVVDPTRLLFWGRECKNLCGGLTVYESEIKLVFDVRRQSLNPWQPESEAKQ